MNTQAEIDGDPRYCFQPGRLWSLWDMKDWEGAQIVISANFLSGLNQFLYAQRSNASIELTPTQREGMEWDLRFLHGVAEKHDFDVLADCIDEAQRVIAVKLGPATPKSNTRISQESAGILYPMLARVLKNLESTLKGRKFFALTAKAQRLYSDDKPLFGDDVFAKFPDATKDISEAGKCLALGRNTATVFHLMRAMETCRSRHRSKTQSHDK